MSKKQKKGFTLVELLAVIVILAIILIIAVAGVLSIIKQTKENAYDRQIDMIKEATKNYMTSESDKIQWKEENGGIKKTEVPLQVLQSSGYLDKKLIDPRDKSEIKCATTIVWREADNKMTYTVKNTDCPTDESCFTFDSAGNKITNYSDSCPKDVIIPSTIGGVPVTTIGSRTFESKQLTSVIIPDSVIFIDEMAFHDNQITSITIPNQVKEIGQFAFHTNQLTSVTIPASVTKIESWTLNENPLTSIVIKGKTDLSEFSYLGGPWYSGTPTITFEP